DKSGRSVRDLTLVGVNTDGKSTTLNFDATVPSGSLVIYSASTWEDAAEVAKKVDGKSIIVAYPPPPGITVSAAWLVGTDDVPTMPSTKVPGLVPARDLIRLLQHPKDNVWRPPTDE